MTRIILLDTGPLGYVAHPNDKGENGACKKWLETCRNAGLSVKVPQIADYELRRELIRIKSATSIALLNKLIRSTGGLARFNNRVMQKAAELWADSRLTGKQTCDNTALDGDMILCAQALVLAEKGDTVEVATTNPKHLVAYITAKLWKDITV